MAVVYEVLDTADRARVALKRPVACTNAEQQRRTHELFEREFHTLSQLAHPRIVEVHDYGRDEHGPYYTMELLDGGDLQRLARADFRRVCAIARDVCSALSLLHSRRVLHRDVSTRNIRCTADGTAKLIDFGAIALMGPGREVVGTPVYVPPEVVNQQPLDARTDLYALGATLYYALTGHHAYPVRNFASLPDAWRFALAPPSELVEGIPAALDSLVLDLLQLDLRHRPSSAAEVMERLAAIEGRPVDEHLLVAQAYLSTPAFVGREPQLQQVRGKLERALRKRGGALLVEGPAGVGRSRFLDASVLQGKLLGMNVVRADKDSAECGDYGVMRALLLQLHSNAPELVRAACVGAELLRGFAPELFSASSVRPESFRPSVHAPEPKAANSVGPELDAAELRPQLQAAIRQFLLAVAERQPLLIAIDDLEGADEPSVAALALLARGLRNVPIAMVATAGSAAQSAASSAFRLYSGVASRLALEPLDQDETRDLLGTIFGDSVNLDLLVQRAFSVSQGNPRDLMRLSQHLLDRGLVRYRGGAWSLPSQIDASDLPESMAQLLRAREKTLSAGARQLALALALCPEHSFSFEECCVLLDHAEPGRLMRKLQRLIKADVLRSRAERFALSDRAFVPLLLATVDPAQKRATHFALARVFEQRGGEEFRVAQHLLRAGDRAAALDRFVEHALRSQELTDRSPEEFYKLISNLPEDWLSSYEEALEACRALDRPKRQEHALLARLTGLVAVVGLRDTRHARALIAQLSAAAGLDDWARLDPALEPRSRLTQALATTQQRYDSTPEHERTLEPMLAVRALARAFITAVGVSLPLLDRCALAALPPLAPLAPLSPSLALIVRLLEGVQARLAGRFDQAHAIYHELLVRSSAPDRAAFDVSHHRYMRVLLMNGVGMLEASMGLESSLHWAREIEADALLQANGVLVRMLYRLFQGDCVEAERMKASLDALRIASSARQNFENSHLAWQVIVHAQMEDLTRLKRTLDEMTVSLGEYPGWQPVLAYGHAEYQRVRGDLAGALAGIEAELERTHVGEHQIWPELAAAHVRALDESGSTAQAVRFGSQYVALANAAQLGFSANALRLAFGVAQARAGHTEAAATVQAVLDDLEARGTTGLNALLAYEARARVAIAQHDEASYQTYQALFFATAQRSGNAALLTKGQRLLREAQRRKLISALQLPAAGVRRSVSKSLLQSKLEACASAEERARVSLGLLAEHSGATLGFLYRITGAGPVWVAAVGTQRPPSASLHAMAGEYIAAELQGHDVTTGADGVSEARTEWTAFGGACYRPVLLSHYAQGAYQVTGLAVFALKPGQPFVYPTELATHISRMSVDAGDATAILVRDA